MFDLRHIRHFEAVYRLGNFSKAADEVSLSQSAITKSIRSLETLWDVDLFHRTTRSVAPTEAGKRLYPLAVNILAYAENVRRETRGGARELRIVSGPAVLELLIQPALLHYRDGHGHMRVSAESMPPAYAADELIQRRAHLLLYHTTTMAGLPHNRRLHIETLFEEPYMVAFRPGHPMLETDGTLSALLAFDWAVAGYDQIFEGNLPDELRDLLQRSDFPRYRLLSQTACLALSASTDVLTAAPKSALAPYLADGSLEARPHPAGLEFSVSAATLPETRHEPAISSFIDSVRLLTATS